MEQAETSIEKVMRIGKTNKRYGGKIFVKVTFYNNKLSFSGVIGPLRSGNAERSAGQVCMEFKHRNPADDDKRCNKLIKPGDIKFARGWDRDLWFDLLDVWEQWHLNDMREGCKHQRDAGWGTKELVVVEYQLTPEAMVERGEIKKGAIKRLVEGEKVWLTEHEAFMLSLPYAQKRADNVIYSKDYREDSRETKMSGWVKETEHPEGVLMKACPVCGYKYGSKWLHEDVPQNVLDQIKSWPDADESPAWI